MYNEDFSEENFDTCDCCKKIYSLPFLKYHYRTDAHQELLDIKFPERIGTILNTGEALISAEFNETE
jgi:hypothetical protein